MHDLALLMARLSVGGFFAVSGYHKLFNTKRRASLRATFNADHVRDIPVMMWLIPIGELTGGWAPRLVASRWLHAWAWVCSVWVR